MRALGEVAGQELLWVEPVGEASTYELHAGNVILATLFWEARYSAVAETAEGRMRFKREGVLNQRNVVRAVDTDTDIALYKPRFTTSGGTLVFPDERSFKWRNTSFWGSHKVWTDAQGTPLITFKSSPLSKIVVVIGPEATKLPELPLLTMLGCYLLVLAYRDTTKIAATAAPSMP